MNKLWQNRLDGLRSTITNVSALSDGAARSGAHFLLIQQHNCASRPEVWVPLTSLCSLQAPPGSGS